MGSAVRVLDSDGETVEASAYDPFGKETEHYEKTRKGSRFNSPHGFGGYEKTGKKDIYRTLAREYNGATGRFQTGDSEMYIHPYVPVSANLYQYGWNSPLQYADPMGRDVEESEWEGYLELGLTGYVKYGYHQIADYASDRLDEDIEKVKTVAKAVWRVVQMSPVEQAEASLRVGAAVYNSVMMGMKGL